jgi:hypothetical protein
MPQARMKASVSSMRSARWLYFSERAEPGDEIQVPLMHLMQVGKTALGEGAQQVQGGGGLVIGLQQTIRVRHAALFVETDAVDDVAAIGRQGDAIDGFVVGGARLGELPGHAPDLDHRATGGEGHDNRHLQQHLEGVADFRGGKLEEALGAVATLQQKRATLGHFGKLTAQLAGFTGEHQWRITGQRLLDTQHVICIGVLGLLLDRQGPPAVGAPGLAHLLLECQRNRTAMVAVSPDNLRDLPGLLRRQSALWRLSSHLRRSAKAIPQRLPTPDDYWQESSNDRGACRARIG